MIDYKNDIKTESRELLNTSQIMMFPDLQMSGSELIARSLDLLLDDKAVVMAVPGSPTTKIIKWLETNSKLHGSKYWVDMSEVDMMRKLLGANANGLQSVAIMKHTGFFRIQEQLIAMSNHDLLAPMVLLVGDEPGASSQNGNDSRSLCDANYLPIIEPSFQNIPESLAHCLVLSAELRKPVVFRVVPGIVDYTSALMNKVRYVNAAISQYEPSNRDYYATEGMVIRRYTHTKILLRGLELELIKSTVSRLNTYQHNNNSHLVVAAGNIADRARDVLARTGSNASFLEINTVTQLPEKLLTRVLSQHESVLILESWEPYLELRIRAIVQRISGLTNVVVHGRESNINISSSSKPPLASAGDVSDDGILQIMQAFLADIAVDDVYHRNGSQEHNFSDDIDNRYISIFEIFCSVAFSQRKEPIFSISTGRTRYSVMHSKYEQYVKFMAPMGSEAMTLLGYLEYANKVLAPCIIIGDYTFCHSSWHGLSSINSFRKTTGQKVPTIIIDNGGSWTTGGQNCITPTIVGSRLVVGWKKRLYGSIIIHQRKKIQQAITELLDASNPYDILIIRTDD